MANIAVLIFSNQLEGAVVMVESGAPARGEDGDDNVRHLGDLRHQGQHRIPRHFDHARSELIFVSISSSSSHRWFGSLIEADAGGHPMFGDRFPA